MTCPVCGNEYPCIHSRQNTSRPGEQHHADFGRSTIQNGAQKSLTNDRQQWRSEIISRVQRQHAKRQKEADPNAMEFEFPIPEHPEEPAHTIAYDLVRGEREFVPQEIAGHTVRQEAPKIIRFPGGAVPAIAERLTYPEPEPAEEVAPRIFEAVPDPVLQESIAPSAVIPRPQQMELPCFDDIQLEEGHQRLSEESEIVPQPAPLQHRAVATAIDLALLITGWMIFALTFREIAEDSPTSRMALLCGVCVAGALWLLYQYMFLVYGRGTLGMRMVELELATFEGKRLTSRDRRYRALASVLSALSLGLGYAWALVDEDQLGWHDRITQTVERSTYHASPRPLDRWED
jgi:uncharacterized RDD family membrane protein YckC